MATFGPYRATVAGIHDGDTIYVDVVLVPSRLHRHTPDVDLGFNVHLVDRQGVILEHQSVRLYGCNAAELNTIEGKAALAYLETLLHVGDVVTLVSYGWDKYGGRIDGTIRLPDGRDLTETMIAAGQAAPWDGTGPRPSPAST